MSLITQPVVPFVASITIDKYYIFHKPDETMLSVMMEAFLHLKNILLSSTLKDSIFSYNELLALATYQWKFTRLLCNLWKRLMDVIS